MAYLSQPWFNRGRILDYVGHSCIDLHARRPALVLLVHARYFLARSVARCVSVAHECRASCSRTVTEALSGINASEVRSQALSQPVGRRIHGRSSHGNQSPGLAAWYGRPRTRHAAHLVAPCRSHLATRQSGALGCVAQSLGGAQIDRPARARGAGQRRRVRRRAAHTDRRSPQAQQRPVLVSSVAGGENPESDRVLQHGVRSFRSVADLRGRAWRPGGRSHEVLDRSRRAGGRSRLAVPAGVLSSGPRLAGQSARALPV